MQAGFIQGRSQRQRQSSIKAYFGRPRAGLLLDSTVNARNPEPLQDAELSQSRRVTANAAFQDVAATASASKKQCLLHSPLPAPLQLNRAQQAVQTLPGAHREFTGEQETYIVPPRPQSPSQRREEPDQLVTAAESLSCTPLVSRAFKGRWGLPVQLHLPDWMVPSRCNTCQMEGIR